MTAVNELEQVEEETGTQASKPSGIVKMTVAADENKVTEYRVDLRAAMALDPEDDDD